MRPMLQFDFRVNKKEKTIEVVCEFDAQIDLVWKAWTTPELLDQWWGPQPWHAQTKTMDFREGGYWLYAMVSPEGKKHWSKVSYLSIEHEKSFTAKDGFSDENGVINTHFPQNLWKNLFRLKEDRTIVSILLTFDTLEDLEKIIEMGFKEGFTMGLNQLDELLTSLQKK